MQSLLAAAKTDRQCGDPAAPFSDELKLKKSQPVVRPLKYSGNASSEPGASDLERRSNSAGMGRKPQAGDNESDLIERLKNGDETALETLFNAYSAKLYTVAFRILGDIADTQEVIQDVFWTAYRKAKTFRGAARISTWLYRLTVNAALGKLRRSRKGKEVDYEEFLPKFQEDGHHWVQPQVDWSNALEESHAAREIRKLLQQALALLRPLDKSIVVLSDLEGLSDKEIAAAAGISVPAVKTRLHRARLFLRGKLAAHLGYS